MAGATNWHTGDEKAFRFGEENPLHRSDACLLPAPQVAPATNGCLRVLEPIRHYFFAALSSQSY